MQRQSLEANVADENQLWRLDLGLLVVGFLGYTFKYLDQTNIVRTASSVPEIVSLLTLHTEQRICVRHADRAGSGRERIQLLHDVLQVSCPSTITDHQHCLTALQHWLHCYALPVMHHRVPFRPPPVASSLRDCVGSSDLLSVSGKVVQDGEPDTTRDLK